MNIKIKQERTLDCYTKARENIYLQKKECVVKLTYYTENISKRKIKRIFLKIYGQHLQEGEDQMDESKMQTK